MTKTSGLPRRSGGFARIPARRRGGTLVATMMIDQLTGTAPASARRQHRLPPWEVYQAWRAAFADADEALGGWRRASPFERAAAYAVYRAAADREDAAAADWLAS
jgi:hypothetical protein